MPREMKMNLCARRGKDDWAEVFRLPARHRQSHWAEALSASGGRYSITAFIDERKADVHHGAFPDVTGDGEGAV